MPYLGLFLCFGIIVFGSLIIPKDNVAHAKNNNGVNQFSTKSVGNYTIGQAEKLLMDYFNKKGIKYNVSVKKNVNILEKLLIGDKEFLDLEKKPYYNAVRAYASTYIQQLDQAQGTSVSSINSFHLDSTIKNQTIKEIRNENEQKNIQSQTLVSPLVSSGGGGSGYSYDSTAAVNYAHKYYNNWNTGTYGSYYPDDCTNFASQVVHAGGMPMLGSTNTSNATWNTTSNWYDRYVYDPKSASFYVTTSWIRVVDFYTYWTSYQFQSSETFNTESSAFYNYAKVGDIVQLFDASGSKGWHHTMIVTSKYGGNLYLAGHNNNRIDWNWHNIDDSTNDFRVIKFNY